MTCLKKYNLCVKRGDTWESLIFTISEDGTPVDITGFIFYFTIKENVSDTDDDAIFKKDWSTHLDQTTNRGQTILNVSAIESDPLAVGKFHYEVKFKSTNEVIYTVTEGDIKINDSLTIRAND